MATAEQITEKEMRRLERKVSALYRESAKELRATVRDYWASYAVRLNDMKEQLAAGEITKDYYSAWVRNNVGRGQRWEALRDDIAKRAADTNQIAAAYVNDTTPGIYSLNANRTAYTIQASRPDIDFALVDEQAVKNLARGNNQFEFKVSDGAGGYTYRRLQPNYIADYNWNSRQIERQLTLGILRGDGPKEFTERFLSIMGSNLSAAIRNARTSITSAHNAGTMHTLRAARDMGINVKKQWLSTSDGRTRDSHVDLNGEQAEIDDAFSNGCLYPADPAGVPAEVYNCRCTMVYVLPDVSAEPLPEQETQPETETEQQTEQAAEQDEQAAPWVDNLHPQKIAGVKRTAESMTFEEADNYSVNPNFWSSRQYRINCQTCVVANEARRRGYDVVAGANRKGGAAYACSHRTELAWIDPDTGEHPKRLYDESATTEQEAFTWINATVQQGERYTLQFLWESGGGHIVNLDRTETGELRIHDNQPGKLWGNVEHVGEEQIEKYLQRVKVPGVVNRYYEDEIDEKGKHTVYYQTKVEYYTGVSITRVDNMEFNPRFVDHALKKA